MCYFSKHLNLHYLDIKANCSKKFLFKIVVWNNNRNTFQELLTEISRWEKWFVFKIHQLQDFVHSGTSSMKIIQPVDLINWWFPTVTPRVCVWAFLFWGFWPRFFIGQIWLFLVLICYTHNGWKRRCRVIYRQSPIFSLVTKNIL